MTEISVKLDKLSSQQQSVELQPASPTVTSARAAASERTIDEITSKMFPVFSKSAKTEDDMSEDNHGHISSISPQALEKISAALFYGITSLAVIFTNKQIMTGYDFPYFDFLAAVQFLATSVVLSLLVVLRRLDIPTLTPQIFKEILPISCMFLGNVICGLGSTRSLNLPMMTALRRFSILMTMCAEYFILGSKPATPIIVSVVMMVGGALFAASFDISFDVWGYTMVFMNNVFTAMNGVWMKKATMGGKCSKLGVLYYNSLFSGIAMFIFFALEHWYFYQLNAITQQQEPVAAHLRASVPEVAKAGAGAASSVVSVSSVAGSVAHRLLTAVAGAAASLATGANTAVGKPLTATVAAAAAAATNGATVAAAAPIPLVGAVSQVVEGAVIGAAHLPEIPMSTISMIMLFEGWARPDFLALFILAAFLGSVLNYSIFLCTTVNSALTTAVVGCLKNVLTTYVGMIVFPDYVFDWMNFIGLNISIAGSLYYTYFTMFKGFQGFGQ